MSSIKPTGGMTAASCTACSWVANTARSAANSLVASANKIADFVAASFRSLAQYASIAMGHVKNNAIAGLNYLKANPQVAIGGGVALLVLAAAAYAYSQRESV
jgi:hypothetical protein